MPKYTVQSPLRRNGEDIEVGESVDLSAKEAKGLVEAGVLTPAKAAASGSDSGDAAAAGQ